MTEWRSRAACRGLDGKRSSIDFFKLDILDQRRLCANCPVRFDCLQETLADEAGIEDSHVKTFETFGGLTGLERVGLRRRAA